MQNTKKKKLARKQTSSATRNSRLLSFQGPAHFTEQNRL